MATTKQGNSRGGNRRSGNNNNPAGHNQYSGIKGTARQNPLATAAAVGGAVAAGVFLWSRRNEISDQIGNLSDQISDWREGMTSEGGFGEEPGKVATTGSRDGRSQAEISQEALSLKETGRTA
jgi:hypothetical protein